MASIHDVAAAVLAEFSGPISTMKLQKLVFFSHAWKLGLTGRPMFNSRFEAWANGPVAPDLFRSHRLKFQVSADSWKLGDPSALGEIDRTIVQAVVKVYRNYSGVRLSEITHRPGTPWRTARKDLEPDERSNNRIDDELIRSYYAPLFTAVGNDLAKEL